MYYPPCKYDPDNPSSSSLPTEPCIPFPDPPKCNKSIKNGANSTLLLKLKSLTQHPPCLNPDGCVSTSLDFRNLQTTPIKKLNSSDFNNLNYENLLSHQNSKDETMLYNKWLLFNTNCKLNLKKAEN